MIIFIHTPKCGGKSLKESLRKVYGDKMFLDYPNPLEKSLIHKLRAIARKIIFFNKSFELVYGHFCFDNYKKLISQKSKTAMFFRDPIDLISSYYFYSVEKYPNRHYKDIISFSKQKKIREFYKLFLGQLQVEDITYIGIVEEYAKSLRLYKKIIGPNLTENHFNITVKKPKNYKEYLKERGLLEEMKNLMEENIKIYNRAKERFNYLCDKYNVT